MKIFSAKFLTGAVLTIKAAIFLKPKTNLKVIQQLDY
jgi:hypothetical protein